MRILVDNDVVLDVLIKREPFYYESRKIFSLAASERVEIFIATITAINAFYTIRKEKDKDLAFEAIEGLSKLVAVCRTEANVLATALSLNFRDFEDAVQCASAIAEGLNAIVTRNKKDFANSPLPIYSPAEFVELLANAKEDDDKVQ